MDKSKIGHFVSTCRKDKGITQEQLAQKLDVSNKSVSKWENGNCLPDKMLLKPLCDILDITISEFFAGERLESAADVQADHLQMLQALKKKLYYLSNRDVSFEEFDSALNNIFQLSTCLKKFPTKEDAVAFLVKETSCSQELCAQSYDFYIHLFDIQE